MWWRMCTNKSSISFRITRDETMKPLKNVPNESDRIKKKLKAAKTLADI